MSLIHLYLFVSIIHNMSTQTLSTQTLLKYLLLTLYILTGTLSNFKAIDILAPQWIYLGLINSVSCLFLFFNTHDLNTSYKRLYRSVFIYVYLFYILWNAFSYFYAINQVETLINLPRLVNTFFAIYFSYLLISSLPNKFFFISRLFIAFLSFEILAYYNDFFISLNEPNFSVLNIKGFAGNKNITAASIAFKIPFVLYLLNMAQKRYFRVFLFTILFASVFAVSVIEARSAILSSLIVITVFIGFLITQIFIRNITPKKGIVMIALTLLPYVLSLGVNILLSQKTERSNLTQTVGKIAFTEESSNGRFEYWTDALNYVMENPIFASGLGNWKIASISRGKEHINGYTVPYHAHNDFIHVFAETGVFGGLAYIMIFGLLTFYLFRMLYVKYHEKGQLEMQYFFLLLPLIVYGIDAGLNFPVARPLMQSSFAIFAGLILTLYLGTQEVKADEKPINTALLKGSKVLIMLVLLPALYVHVLSYISLTKQGRLLYEFNNASFKMTRAELDEISHDFPNLTETAMPIKAMKARYYYLQGNKEEAFQMIDEGIKDNPEIFFGENLKALYYLNENKVDSAFVYAKKAFEGLPNNMPHYDVYMRTLVLKKDYTGIDNAFNLVQSLAGDTKTIWLIYIRSLAQTRSLGDPFAMEKAAEAYRLYPEDETIFLLYRILTYGQPRVAEAEQIFQKAKEAYDKKQFANAADLFGQAFDLDPLRYNYSLNAGLSYYEDKQYDQALKYFDLSLVAKRGIIAERAMRFKALSLLLMGEGSRACAVFLKLRNTYPKRMYQQEFQKYCLKKN